jgi:ribosomal-protein-alanine N-acetyltransferase
MMVREATAADVDAVEALERACFPEDPWTRAMVAEELTRPGARFLVAEMDGAVVGFAIGLVVLDELSVLQVAVAPERRGARIGRALMEALHASARWQEVAWLEVRRGNAPAIALYQGLGYDVISVRPRYYADGEDAVILRARLSPPPLANPGAPT